ncbi:unnamed protein product [Pleuronectes platessa]|uniref:Uncharacterized protein n=1 Tax=Pleuronectes platessa TaxID=8262 RepID=A0A9N7TRU2_PLEPL|nr:unnamed protein product [Pleuronectes platessa]
MRMKRLTEVQAACADLNWDTYCGKHIWCQDLRLLIPKQKQDEASCGASGKAACRHSQEVAVDPERKQPNNTQTEAESPFHVGGTEHTLFESVQ